MDTQQLLKLYKESLESVLTSLENKEYSSETFGKRQELQKKIPGQTDCEDTNYENFVKTSNSVREQLDKYVRNQQSADLHKENSVDEDNKDVVTGDNSNTICQQPTNEKEEEDKEPKNEDVKGDESKRRCQQPTNEKEEEDKEPKNEDVKGDESKRRCQQPTNEKEEEDKEPKNEDVKGDESKRRLEKLRNECEQLKVRVKELEGINASLEGENEGYKMYEKEYNKVTEGNTADQQSIKAYEIYISKLEDENTDLKQRHQQYQKDYNKAKEEKTTLQERCEDLEKCINTLEDKNSKLQQRLDRLQSPISVQVKELQKRIDIKTAENESLTKILKSQEKYMKETERSGQRSLRPKTAPHSSASHYKELQNQIDTLRAEKESLMQRLSMVAGMKMRDNNPGIADLSDPNRPEKLGEQFREIYDNAWTNLLDYISDNTDTSDDIAVQQIVAATQEIFEQCQKEVGKIKRLLLRIIGYPEDTFEKQYTGGKAGHDPILKMMKDLVQISAERTYERVLQKIKEIREIKAILQIGGESADVFLTKCSKLCLFMCVKDPPVVLDFNFKRGDMFDKDKLSAFTTSGDSVGYLVWPVMYLHENGPVMSKGVAQGRKK